MRHILLISGKDSLATALVQLRREPDLPYELIHNTTGWDLPEVIEWIGRVGLFLGRDVRNVGDDLTEVCRDQKCLPIAGWRRFCTRLAKIRPLMDYLGTSPAVVYYGLRADEPDRIGFVPPLGSVITPSYPLRDAGYGIEDVWRICQEVDLLPPSFHWQWMEDRVCEKLGYSRHFLDNLRPWDRRQLLAWRSRSNCDRCMYMRKYEQVGLLEHHPDRFEQACLLEEELCHGDGFSWCKGYRLRDLHLQADRIKERRATRIAKLLREHAVRSLPGFVDAVNQDEDDPLLDELRVTSCGLLCGK